MQALITQRQSDDHHTGSAHVLMLEASAPGKSASVCMARWRRSCTAVAKRSAWGLLPSSARRCNSPRLLQSSHARFIPPCAAKQSSSGRAVCGPLSARRAPNTLQHDSALGRAGMRWLHASLARFQKSTTAQVQAQRPLHTPAAKGKPAQPPHVLSPWRGHGHCAAASQG